MKQIKEAYFFQETLIQTTDPYEYWFWRDGDEESIPFETEAEARYDHLRQALNKILQDL